MIIDAVYKYSATIRRRKKRNEDVEVYRASAPIEIRETTAESAPVAMWWKSPALNDKPVVAMRTFEGKLYEPVFLHEKMNVGSAVVSKEGHAKGREAPRVMPAACLKDFFSNENGSSFIQMEWQTFKEEHGSIGEDPTIAEVKSSNQEKVEGQWHQLASMLLVVDNVVYRHVPAPLFVVYMDVRDRAEMKTTYSESTWFDYTHQLFPATRFKEAWALYEKAPAHWTYPSEKSSWAPKILIPEALEFDPIPLMLDDAARQIMKAMKSRDGGYSGRPPNIASRSKDMIRAFAAIRDNKDDKDLTAQVERLEAFVEANRAEDFYVVRDLAHRVEAIIERCRREGRAEAKMDRSDETALEISFR